jgi:ABC-type antimicrobial peptide transport system permease subunit
MFQLKPLNMFLYIKNNMKKFIPQIFVASLGVFLVYFLCILGGGVKSGITSNVISPYEKLSVVHIDNPKIDNGQTYKELSEDSNIDRVIYSSSVTNILTKLLVDTCGTPVFYTETEDTKYLMDKLNFKLIQGKIPDSKNELLINENFAKSFNLKIGDFYGTSENEKQRLNGKYTVVGIYSGKSIITFGFLGNIEEIKQYRHSLIVVPKSGKLQELNLKINSFKNLGYYNTLEREKSSVDGTLKVFNIFAIVMLSITIFVLTFTIGNINYMHFYDRLGEFSILDALGYNKLEIAFKLIKELVVIIFIGYILGVITGIFGGLLFNLVYCEPRGVPVAIFNPWYIFISGCIPITVSLFSFMPVVRFLFKVNTVEILEGRA